MSSADFLTKEKRGICPAFFTDLLFHYDSDLNARERDVLLHSVNVLLERIVMSYELFNGNTHFLSLGKEAESLDILVCTVYPRAYERDLLVAEIEVGVHRAFACVYEEAHLAVSAAAAYVLVSVSRRLWNARALEYEVCAEAVGKLLDLCNSFLDGLELSEVDNFGSTHFLRKSKTCVNTVDCDDVNYARSLQNCYLHKTDRSAALYENGGAEIDKIGGICAVACVYAYASGLDEHSLIKSLSVYNEDGGILANENVLCKPSVVVMLRVILDESVNAEACAEVGKLGEAAAIVALTAQKHGGDYLIADLDGIALCINGNTLTYRYDLARALVTESYLLIAEGIVTVFVNVCTADAAALDLNEYLTGTGCGDLNVAKLNDSFSLDSVYDLRLNKIRYF